MKIVQKNNFKNKLIRLGVEEHVFNPSTWKADPNWSLLAQGYYGIYSELHYNTSYILRPSLKEKKEIEPINQFAPALLMWNIKMKYTIFRIIISTKTLG